MTDSENSAQSIEKTPNSVNPAVIDSVAIKVEAFIGSSDIKISQLNSWRVGSEIALDAALSDLVELRVNGLCVATGELVAIGDKFGVRITSVSA